MKLEIEISKDFKKSLEKLQKSDKERLEIVADKLANNEILEPKYRDHALKGKYIGFRECHIDPDLLLVYQKQDDVLILYLLRIGSHSELF